MKILTALAALAMVATPIAAEARPDRHHHERRYERYPHRDHYRRYDGHRHRDGAVAAGIVALIVGGMIVSSNRRRDDRYCADEQYVDYYGNVRWRRICP